jgi:uncharacterized protein YndB with AHSA1/START domain
MARESVSAYVDVSPERVFDRLVDVANLPGWNDAITEVVELPNAMTPGTVWKVRVSALGRSWVSKSTVEILDASNRRFAYRSQSDDGNPSYADWEWQVHTEGTGSKVAVTVDLHPETFWRKHLLIKVRRPSLRNEMRDSIAHLATTVDS